MTPFYILMGDVNNPPRDLAAWEAFADASAALARHVYELSPRAPVVWEIWNEPHNLNFWRTGPNVNEYAQMAYRTALRLRQTVPHLVVAPGASNLENLGLFWIADSLDLRPGLLDLLDGLSVHGYEPTGRAPPEARFSAFDQAVALTTARGRTLPVVVSEWGWTVGGGAAILPELKAAYDARMLLLAYLQNIPILIHYQWRDMTAAPEDRYGLVDQWYNPRPSHAAVARLTARLSGFAFQGRIPVGHPGDYVLHFTNGNGASRAAMWTTGNPHQILVPNPAGGNAGPYPVNQAPQVIDLPAGF